MLLISWTNMSLEYFLSLSLLSSVVCCLHISPTNIQIFVNVSLKLSNYVFFLLVVTGCCIWYKQVICVSLVRGLQRRVGIGDHVVPVSLSIILLQNICIRPNYCQSSWHSFVLIRLPKQWFLYSRSTISSIWSLLPHYYRLSSICFIYYVNSHVMEKFWLASCRSD